MRFTTSSVKHTGRVLAVFFLLTAVLVWAQQRAPLAGPGRLRVQITDSSAKQPTPARCYLTDAAGRALSPAGAITYAKGAEQHFISWGEFEIALPAGAYTLAVERGPEYRAAVRPINIRPGETRDEKVVLERWIDMNERGWYSGDLHNHRDWRQMPDLLLAEDLNLAATLTEWIWDDAPNSRAPAGNVAAVHAVDARHAYSVFDTEIERLRDGPGAVDLLALRTPVEFRGSLLSPTNDVFADAAHAQGGYVDAEKIVWRDSAALVALGKVDFAGVVYNHFHRRGVETETDSWGMIPKERPEYRTPAGMPLWALDVYYRFLNCGFRLPVSAGSATGVKPSPLGFERVYVRLGKSFDYHAWFRALKEGRSFATNGPMLSLKVNAREPGDTIRAAAGKPVHLVAEVEASSAAGLDRVEIVWKGEVVKSVRANAETSVLRARFELDSTQTGWLAARAFENPPAAARFAQSSPVYVVVGDDPGIRADDVRFFLAWIDRESKFYQKLASFRSEADRAAMLDFYGKARRVYERLLARASR